VYAVLRRWGLSRLDVAGRVTAARVRYVACHPRALLHQDHKKPGRIPDGGGWRTAGRANRPHHGHTNTGYEHLEVLVDHAIDTMPGSWRTSCPRGACGAGVFC